MSATDSNLPTELSSPTAAAPATPPPQVRRESAAVRAGEGGGALPFGDAPEPTTPSVLLVDDRPENLLALAAVLEPLDVDLVRAVSGDDALRQVLNREFAVILLDVQMPGTDGIETARLIKARERSRSTPIIFLTAVDRDRTKATLGYESGAVDYLFKPVDPDILRAKVASFVQLYRHREELAWHQRRRYADAVVRESEERFRLVQKATNDVIWDWDLVSNAIRWNELAARVFGSRPDESPAGVEWRYERLHPDDRQRVVDGLDSAIEAGQSWQAEYRFRVADGAYRTFLDRGYVARDASGRPVRMIGAMQDITERTRAQAEAVAARLEAERARAEAVDARRRAEEANRAKSDFLATMSHEIRTPINAVLGYSELLELGLSGPLTEEQRHHLGRIRASATHLLGLVNEVLDLAKVEAGQMAVRRERASAGEAVEGALALVRPQALERGVFLGVAHAAQEDEDGKPAPRSAAPAYVGDDHRVRQILVNLLSNAVKFTEPGGRVSVRCATAARADPAAHLAGGGPWTSIAVEDTGIGIAAERLSAVFEPFVQAEGGHTRTHGGTGLGLAISRRLARLMGGDLTVTSRKGEGSTFTLWLPAVASGAAEGAEERRAASGERHTPVPRSHGLAAVGELLFEEIDDVVAGYVRRLRADPATPAAKEMRLPHLVDHQSTLVGDLAQSLIIIDEAGGDAAGLLRDGSAIQRTICEHHGARRFAQRWSEDAVRREFAVLGEEIERVVRARLPDDPAAADALAVLTRLAERAAGISLGAWRHAAQSTGG